MTRLRSVNFEPAPEQPHYESLQMLVTHAIALRFGESTERIERRVLSLKDSTELARILKCVIKAADLPDLEKQIFG